MFDEPPNRGKGLMKKTRKVPLVYVPHGILPNDETTICQNPELITGRKDSFCVPWGKKYTILHCWAPTGHVERDWRKESDWLRSEVHYLVEVEPTSPTLAMWWKNWWTGFVKRMTEDNIELYPIIQISSKEHLNSLHGKQH